MLIVYYILRRRAELSFAIKFHSVKFHHFCYFYTKD